MNAKSLITNGLALLMIITGYIVSSDIIKMTGYFALSGALTNWLAIHMLFEKVPLLYGSGVIPNRFAEFKAGIKNLIMQQFFTEENLQRFFVESDIAEQVDIDSDALIAKIDFADLFDALVDALMASKFGAMISMVGGREALEPMRDSVIDGLKKKIKDITQTQGFKEAIAAHISNIDASKILLRVEDIVKARLDELTPQMVKMIIQEMIKQHLGWLVVWGGVFGGLIGFLITFFN